MGVNYLSIIERMRWSGKLKNDSAVARILGVTPQALSNYKKRGEMPTDLVLRFAGIYGLSVDWLITGEGDMFNAAIKSVEEGKGGGIAAEEGAAYGKPPFISTSRVPDIASLAPDEIIMIGKLLKIMRSPNKSTSAAIKYSIEAILKASQEINTQVEEVKTEA